MIPRKVVRKTEVAEPTSLKEQLRKLVDEAPAMPMMIHYPADWAGMYKAWRLWFARLAVLAECPSVHDLVVIAEAK